MSNVKSPKRYWRAALSAECGSGLLKPVSLGNATLPTFPVNRRGASLGLHGFFINLSLIPHYFQPLPAVISIRKNVERTPDEREEQHLWSVFPKRPTACS